MCFTNKAKLLSNSYYPTLKMNILSAWKCTLMLIWMFTVLDLSECGPEVIYSGQLYVLEGKPFNLSCLRSAYGLPKWYRNGILIDPNTSKYSSTEDQLSLTTIQMNLRVESASWGHRGAYKCDALNDKVHRIEIVPSTETDQKLKTAVKGRHRTVLLVPGRILKIVCDKEEHDAFPINWYKDGKRLQAVEGKTEMDGRALTILNAKDSDTGDYVCIFEEKGQSYLYADHQGSKTTVTYGARVADFPPQTRPILNTDFSLECKVQGFPTPRIAWFVDGIEMSAFKLNNSRYDVLENQDGLPDSVFFIRNVTSEDNHDVVCTADNVEGFDKTLTQLAVRENRIFTNEESPGDGITLFPGKDLVLYCNFSDDSSAVFQWYKDEKPVDTTPKSRVVLEPPTYNTLKITSALESDCGNYTCESNNIRATIPVRSEVKIAPLENSRNVVQGQNIVLACNVTQGYPLPILTWYKDEMELNISDPRLTLKTDLRGIECSEVIITDANFEDRAEYTCNAKNEISSYNVTILVRVKDKYAALWPFLGICAEVAVLCTIIFIYEKKRQKPDFDEQEAEQNTENKNVPDQDDKSREVRQRK